jgi:hypothetical protein
VARARAAHGAPWRDVAKGLTTKGDPPAAPDYTDRNRRRLSITASSCSSSIDAALSCRPSMTLISSALYRALRSRFLPSSHPASP